MDPVTVAAGAAGFECILDAVEQLLADDRFMASGMDLPCR